MMNILAVALGGAAGSVMRHLSGKAALSLFGLSFPYGTLFVNVFGSFLMGVAIGAFALHGNVPQEMKSLVTVGFLGGFTTFSAFSLDIVTLYEQGDIGLAALYVVLSLILSLLAIFAGLILMRSFAP
ncbi:MAG: fluoride efflux transporter CrcB [Micavibrio aeruginosavorus]|uniref:Fluoride-specific ion channel FluC n=1 Tax=Micavibrio aeruginosavorus TaxID=349221 RepID=A0A2W5BTH7_9BACT|nr:MAG: fluoride efflux transporter CrcB [Micavibrio aeruginosavorus]